MSRSHAELEELVGALETVWAEQSALAHAYQQEASELWRVRHAHDRIIADLRQELETVRGARLTTSTSSVETSSGLALVPEDPDLAERLARQREMIAERKRRLALF
jgi:2-oxo-4-hydroxy-4-carboxy--5-ureidoimidazoline (OHCU) decarboxylase